MDLTSAASQTVSSFFSDWLFQDLGQLLMCFIG